MDLTDPVALTQTLIRFPTVTPEPAGLPQWLEQHLAGLGFQVFRQRFGDVENLYFARGVRPEITFAGHLDVVPPGREAGWSHGPFSGELAKGCVWGRGAVDMKGAIAAWIAACARAPDRESGILLTFDEEGPSIDGTKPMLAAMAQAGVRLCRVLVGEPTSVERVGDTVKNGRRGSLNIMLTARGVQGHVAYPDRAANPVPVLLDALAALRARRLDDGAEGFQPSNLEVTSFDVGNPTHNLIPAEAAARLNIRFNTAHRGADLEHWVQKTVRGAGRAGVQVEARCTTTGEAFFTAPDGFTSALCAGVEAETGAAPTLSTSGGTSDARFIRAYAPVLELGLCNRLAHQVDERVPVEDLERLTRIYGRILANG